VNFYWFVGIAMAASVSAHSKECTVTVYVSSGPDRDLRLNRAETIAASMFREIGVEVDWLTGSPPSVAADDSCSPRIVLRIDPIADRDRIPDIALAYATPFAGSRACIHILRDRVERGRDPEFATVVLAHVLVHEITHVLEQMDHHAPYGVMKARWNPADYWQMRQNPLPFTAEDVELIHLGMTKRTQWTVTR
jgi:hypothetical protein